jgi:predicted GTPase
VQDSVDYKLMPRGNTPLRDAVGKGIVITGERLAALSEDERPATVIFVIQTDGHENASREYTQDQVNAMINEQTEKWGWTFVFMASGPTAWGASQAYAGTQMGQNVYRSTGTAKGMTVSTAYLSDTVSAVRGGVAVAAAFAGAVDIDDDGTVKTDDPDD